MNLYLIDEDSLPTEKHAGLFRLSVRLRRLEARYNANPSKAIEKAFNKLSDRYSALYSKMFSGNETAEA